MTIVGPSFLSFAKCKRSLLTIIDPFQGTELRRAPVFAGPADGAKGWQTASGLLGEKPPGLLIFFPHLYSIYGICHCEGGELG